MKRNFRQYAFAPIGNREAKLQVEKKVVEVLGELYGNYHPILQVEQNDLDWLNSIGIDIGRQKNHDLCGLNDDYPVGRGIFIDEEGQFVVLVNLEDHIEICMLPDKATSLFSSAIKFTKLIRAFDKLGFANNSYLGNLSISPANLGTAMQVSAKFNKVRGLTEEHRINIEKQHFVDLEIHAKQVNMTSKPCLAP